MRIGLDLDGTLAQMWERMTRELQEAGHPVEYEQFYPQAGYAPVLTAEETRRFYADHRSLLRRSYDIYPGVRAVLDLLSDNEFVAVTTRVTEEEPCPDTVFWIGKHALPIPQVVHSADKAASCRKEGVDVLIEDTAEEALKVAEAGVPVFLFDKHYNRHVDHPLVTRFTHWVEVPRMVRQMQDD